MKAPCFLQTLSLLLLVSLMSAGQSPSTASPARHQFEDWLAAFDGGKWDAYEEFLQKNFASQPARALQDPSFRYITGGFDLRKIEEETPTAVTALLQERASDRFARMTVEVEAAEPHRILKTEMHPVDRPPEFALPALNQDQMLAAVRQRLQESVAADRFAGDVLVAKDGKAIFEQAYGLSDREQGVANSLETRFSIGSMNKMFTAVATMQLVQAGKLRLDDPVGMYLTDYPNKELATKVTIGELLTNTGGTGDIWGPEFDQHRRELRTLNDYINLYGSRPLRFAPGSRWEYSNYGFILLGAVIERVSGQSYYDYVRNHVYQPAGMTATSTGPETGKVQGASVSYTRMGGSAWHPSADSLSNSETSAGGGYSTVGDLLRFADALNEKRLLNAHYTQLLTTGQVTTPFGRDAYGFGVQTINGRRCFGHNGGGPGVNGDLEVCVDSRFIVIVLANLDPPAAEQVSGFIINRLPTEQPSGNSK